MGLRNSLDMDSRAYGQQKNARANSSILTCLLHLSAWRYAASLSILVVEDRGVLGLGHGIASVRGSDSDERGLEYGWWQTTDRTAHILLDIRH